MGQVLKLTCSHCSIDETGCRTYAYVLDLEGKRQLCRHPGQEEHACEILGINYDTLFEAVCGGPKDAKGKAVYRLPDSTSATAGEFAAYFEGRIGVMSGYLCLKCAKWTDLDRHKDPMQCRACGSENIVEFEELGGKPCPFCGKGHIVSKQIAIT